MAKCPGGTVKTGIVTPESWTGPCYVAADLRYYLVITWDKARHSVGTVVEETARINRLLADTICCLLPVPAGEFSKPEAHLESSFSSNGETEDRCPYYKLTIKVA